jgi:hypothetical protein
MSDALTASLVTSKINAIIEETTRHDERPTPNFLNTQVEQVLADALHSLPYIRNHNLVGMVISAADYRATYNPTEDFRQARQFAFTARPEPYNPKITAATPEWERKKLEAEWTEHRNNWDTYDAADAAIKRFIFHRINEVYYISLKHRKNGYRNVTAIQLMNHLRDTYGTVNDTDAIHIQTQIVALNIETWDDIPEYIARVDELRGEAETAGMPIADNVLQGCAHAAALRSEYYETAPVTTEWKRLPVTGRSWALWKQMYTKAHSDKLMIESARNGAQPAQHPPPAGAYQAVQAPPDDSNPFADQVVASMESMALGVESLTAKFESFEARLSRLEKERSNNKSNDTVDKKFKHEKDGYCWSHGYKLKEGHNSSTCRMRLEGHVETATRSNTHGGCTKNKGWDKDF